MTTPSAAQVMCPYCTKPAEFSPMSGHVYSRDHGPLWICETCKAWVGCHPDGKPLGRLANASLRKAKIIAHAHFDSLWARKMRRDSVSKNRARASAYKWLAAQLGIPGKDCHIGMFDEGMCQKVAEVCAPYSRIRVQERSAG